MTKPADFFELLCDDTVFVYDAFLINDDVMQVQWRKRDEMLEDSPHSNVVVAAYVTCHARLELYQYMEMLQDRIFYVDTDSILFLTRDGDPMPPSGSFMGMMCDELSGLLGNGSFITEYVSCGPKNYCYTVKNPSTGQEKTVCKIKGITHTIAAARVVNMQSMLNLLRSQMNTLTEPSQSQELNSTEGHFAVPQMRFHISPFLHIETQYYMKKYQIVYDKRRVQPDFTTLPYGFVHQQ